MLRYLLGAKLNTVKGALKSRGDSRTRGPMFVTLSVLFAVALFRSSRWIVLRSMDIQPVGELLVQKLLATTLLIFFGILTFSNIITAFNTFYLSDDLDFLMAHPIAPNSLFISRFIESIVLSSWVFVLFGLPAFVGAGVALNAGAMYYVALFGLFMPFAAIPTAIATLVSLVVTNVLKADRFRDALIFFVLLILVVIFALARAFKVEKLLNPESFDSVGELLGLLTPPEVSLLPSDWMVDVFRPLLFGYGQTNTYSLGLLILTPIALFFVSAWCHRKMYIRGYSMVQEGRHGSSLLMKLRDKLVERSLAKKGDAEQKLQDMAAEGGRLTAFKQLMVKDMTIFTRDASQWSNLLMVVALMIIYLVNYKYFQNNGNIKLIGNVGIYFFNLAVCGFVVVALAGRFLFPAISVEGRSFWIMLQAPISLERLLTSKWLGSMPPVLFVGQLMIWASNILVTQSIPYMFIGSAVVLLHTAVVAAMAVGMGALYPQFNNPNAASIASSFGATIFIITSIGVVLVDLILLSIPMIFVTMYQSGMTDTLNPFIFVFTAIGIIFPIFIGWFTLRRGAASLRKRL